MKPRLAGALWILVAATCLVWSIGIVMLFRSGAIRGSHAGDEFGSESLGYVLLLLINLVGATACLVVGRRALVARGSRLRRDDAYRSIAVGLFYLLPSFVGVFYAAPIICGGGLVLAGLIVASFTPSRGAPRDE